MEITRTYTPSSRNAWRTWLRKNHRAAGEIWVVFYKRHTGRPSIRYAEAVEEALCFGWIDGILKRIDGDRYAQRFTPRRKGSNWSALNKRRVLDLLACGKMTAAGRLLLPPLDELQADKREHHPLRKPVPRIPREFRMELVHHPAALEYFETLAPSHRRRYLLWITSARTQETRTRRIRESLRLLRQRKPLGMK